MELFKLPRTLGRPPTAKHHHQRRPLRPVREVRAQVRLAEGRRSVRGELERALEVIRLKQEADANRTITDFGVDGIQVLNGRYGPYVTDGKKNAKIPKDRDPKTLTLEECRVLIEQAPERGTGRFGRGRRRCRGQAAAGSAQAANGKTTSAAPQASQPERHQRHAGNGTDASAAKTAAKRRGRRASDRCDRWRNPPAGAAAASAKSNSRALSAKKAPATKAVGKRRRQSGSSAASAGRGEGKLSRRQQAAAAVKSRPVPPTAQGSPKLGAVKYRAQLPRRQLRRHPQARHAACLVGRAEAQGQRLRVPRNSCRARRL